MIRQSLSETLKAAMRQRDDRTVKTVRLIMAAIKDRDIAARTSHGNSDGLSDQEIQQLLQTMVKQRRESISLYEQGGRLDLATAEAEEIGVIEQFLPKQMSDDEIHEVVHGVMADLEAEGLKDMGRVMGELRARYAGRMDFAKASAAAKQALS